jgi:6-phosphogluconate dehydrogenase
VQIGMVGLGRMGANMVRRLIRGGHECIVFNRTQERVKELVRKVRSAPPRWKSWLPH